MTHEEEIKQLINEIDRLEKINRQRTALMAIVSGYFQTPCLSEEEAKSKGKLASHIATVLDEFDCRVGDDIEQMTLMTIVDFCKEQVEIESLKENLN